MNDDTLAGLSTGALLDNVVALFGEARRRGLIEQAFSSAFAATGDVRIAFERPMEVAVSLLASRSDGVRGSVTPEVCPRGALVLRLADCHAYAPQRGGSAQSTEDN